MKRILFISFLFWGFTSNFLSAKIWINELMQSNIDGIRDDLNDFPDSWIELYNDSKVEVNISNWTISTNANYQRGWKINVDVRIAPKSYLLVYADKAAVGLHTDFRLDSGSGGAVYLFDRRGNQIDSIKSIPRQPAPNIAYGRISDGNDTWMHFVTATPGSKNIGKTSNVLPPAPVFSQVGGIYYETVILRLSLPARVPDGVTLTDIHYTLDNSEPTLDSPVYTQELTISETTVVRAKVIHPDYLAQRATVHSYIISNKELALPVVSISTDSTYLWDEDFGIYCRGNGNRPNWESRWRRPINFEYFPLESNTSVLNQLCEMRIHGGYTRLWPLKSLVIYGHKRFGTARFDYDLFVEKPNQEIKSFLMRNSGNDFFTTHFRDAAMQLFLGGKVNVDYQAYQPAILYLNGKYWGILNLRERSDEDFVLANYGTTNVDVIEQWLGNVKAGDRVAWDNLMNELRKTPSERNMEWIKNQVDIDEFINYMILEIYVSNIDFPHNNVSMWRPRTIGGKWRFILKDLDLGLGLFGSNPATRNSLEYNTESNADNRKLFNALLTDETFRKEFYSRFAIYMGDLLHINSTSQLIDSIQTMLSPAYQDHIARYTADMGRGSMAGWNNNIINMKNWCKNRNVEVYNHLKDFFDLGALMKLTFKYQDDLSETPTVFINGVKIRERGLNASFFENETLHLRYDGMSPRFGWAITKTVNRLRRTETYFEQDFVYPIETDCTSLEIKLVDNPNATEKIASPEIYMWISDNRLYINNIQYPSVISIYDIQGRLISTTATSGASITIPYDHKGLIVVKVENESHSFVRKVMP